MAMTDLALTHYDVTESLFIAFAHFNTALFEDRLPPVVITLQRKKNARGYFLNDAFTNRIEASVKAHEIAMNPDAFEGRTDKEILATLTHEMVHHWHELFGKPGKNGYHNAEWAEKMVELGLQPMSLDSPGKMTGRKVTHEVVEDGPFDLACTEFLAEGHYLAWQAAPMLKLSKVARNKIKYTCQQCGTNVWGKPDLNVMCGECDCVFEIAN